MRYLFLIALLGMTGCVVDADSVPPQEETAPDQSPEPGGYYDRGDDLDPCPSTVEVLKLPDGTTQHVVIPGLCAQYYHYEGDPPPDEELFDPDVNVNPEVMPMDDTTNSL
jgi:hypothetical protein